MLNKLRNLLRLGVISSPGDDSKQLPSQLVDYHGKEGDAVPWYPYGMHAIAEEGAYALVISVDANGEERICIPTSMLSRPKGVAGEVFIFHPLTGTQIKLSANGDVTVNAIGSAYVVSPTLVRITSPETEIVGNLDVSGSVGIGGDTLMTGSLNVLTNHTVVGNTILGASVTANGDFIGQDHEHLINGTGNYSDGPVVPQP